jgi:hypothetical protein
MISIPCQFAALFKLEAVKADGSRRVLADWFPNLILDQGLDYLGESAGGHLAACQVGSGSTAPSNAQTALVSYVAGTNNVISDTGNAQGSAPYYGWQRRVYRFAQGAAAGNLSEVGVGRTGATGSLFSRALILDGGGTPTTITVLADEFLDVTYECRQYPPLEDVEDEITISGVDYDYVVRAALVTSSVWSPVGEAFAFGGGGSLNRTYSGPLGAVTGLPADSASGTASGTLLTYSAGDYYRDAKLSWSIAVGNAVGGVGAVDIATTRGVFQIGFTPSIPKDSTKILELTFRISWARKTL